MRPCQQDAGHASSSATRSTPKLWISRSRLGCAVDGYAMYVTRHCATNEERTAPFVVRSFPVQRVLRGGVFGRVAQRRGVHPERRPLRRGDRDGPHVTALGCRGTLPHQFIQDGEVVL